MERERSKTQFWKITVTWVLRIICGALFIFSGFVKGIDPWGTIFKVEDYLAAFGYDIPFSLIRLGVFLLCAVEFTVGVFLMAGCFRKSCPVIAILIMCFMLPFSLWIAIKNPVADCGCFGDAWHISNWFTFWKNIAITAGLLWLIVYNLSGICLITPAFQWLAVLASGVFIVFIEFTGYYYQPLLDFRNYPSGSSLFSTNEANTDPAEYEFIYEKDGERKAFSLENLPEDNSGWEFIERKELPGSRSDKPSEDVGLHVFDVETSEDITDELSDEKDKLLIVMIPNVAEVSPSTTWKLNSLYEWSEENGVRMIGIVSGSVQEIDTWEDLSMASYPVYVADDTSIKEVVRGNPAIIYMDDGRIIWKSSLSSIDIEDFLASEVSGDASTFARDDRSILRTVMVGYLIFMAFLVLISFTPRLARLMTRSGLASNKGVRHHN